ncbi:MAG: FecR domain-containing protein [Planctomycetota bacterium]
MRKNNQKKTVSEENSPSADWIIDSISSVASINPPDKQQMEKLLPPAKQGNWEMYKHEAYNGQLLIYLGHIAPLSSESAVHKMEQIKAGYLESCKIMGTTPIDFNPAIETMRQQIPDKYDFSGMLIISGFVDENAAKQQVDIFGCMPTGGLDHNLTGMPNTSMKDLIKAFVPKKDFEKIEAGLEQAKKQFSKSGINIQKETYLGEEALCYQAANGKKSYMYARIKNILVSGMFLCMASNLQSGDTRCSSLTETDKNTGAAKPSTLAKEGLMYKEEAENILRSLFAHIKGTKLDTSKNVSVEIIRGSNIIKDIAEKFQLNDGDIISADTTSQINISDNTTNKITIANGGRIKLKSKFEFELLFGPVTFFINKLKPKTGFKVHTDDIVISGSEGVFSVYADKNTVALTVMKGEAEISDLKGNKSTVKSNQTCHYMKGLGLQKPITLPINFTEQFKFV